MGSLRTYSPGTEALFAGRPCSIVRAIGTTTVQILLKDTGEVRTVEVSDLDAPEKNTEKRRKHPDAISPKDLQTAEFRFAVIKPYLTGRYSEEELSKPAQEAGVTARTIRRWIRAYSETGVVSALVNNQPKKRKRRLSLEVEAIIEDSIRTEYLSKQRKNGQKVVQKVVQLCRGAGLQSPSHITIRNRLKEVDAKEATKKRRGKKAARDKFNPVLGKFPGADYPLAVVQIDHTPLDIIVVDDVYRQPIGRPWLTLAIDCFSRMITGYYLSLDHPSAFSVGMCLQHSILTKDAELVDLDIEGRWDVWGRMAKVHADNGKDFRSNLVKSALTEHGISMEWRPVRTPHWGGHIERILGTIAEEIHALPGTTFSNVQERGAYDSEKSAVMTMDEMQRWLVQWIVGVYHQREHRSLQTSPAAKWEQGIRGDGGKRVGIGIPDQYPHPERLRLDFLPVEERTVQRQGIVWDHVHYFSEYLRRWIGSRYKQAPRKFKVRRDPRDISKIYFLDPDLDDYVSIPCLDKSRPSISAWEMETAVKFAKERGHSKLNEEIIFDAWERLNQIVEVASADTKRIRKEKQKNEQHRKGLEKQRAKPTPTGKPHQGGLKVVVDNDAAVTPTAERFEIDDDEINSGWGEWT